MLGLVQFTLNVTCHSVADIHFSSSYASPPFKIFPTTQSDMHHNFTPCLRSLLFQATM